MKIYFPTSNDNKIALANRFLKPLGIEVVHVPIELTESRAHSSNIIAKEKAKEAYAILKKPLITEDSGFFIEALGGFPMTQVKFSLSTVGVNKILKMLEGEKNRNAYWKTTIAYTDGKMIKTFSYIKKGIITEKLRPVKRKIMSDFWRVYVPKDKYNPNNLALSEMEDKFMKEYDKKYFDKYNHFVKLGKWLKKNAKK